MRKLMIGIMPLFILLSGCSKKSSVGIIGGADGPTTIFITGSKTWFFISSFVGLILIFAIIYLIIKKRK